MRADRRDAGAARRHRWSAQKERLTRTGSRMAWVRLSDAAGSCEVTLFSEVLARARDLLADGNAVLVTADLRHGGRGAADHRAGGRVAGSGGGRGRGGRCASGCEQTEAVPHIRALLGREGRGRGRVVLVPRLGTTQSVEIALPGGFNVTPRLAQAMKVVPGVEQVEEL